ncbi:MAG: TlpA disulfide reductase family protein [Patescibacteria group bacterium]
MKNFGGIKKILFLALIGALTLAISILIIVTISPLLLENLSSGGQSAIKEKAPDFILLDSSGRSVKLSDFAGKKIVLLFWTSWNEVSLEALDILNDYARFPAAKDTVFLAINSEEDKNVVTDIARDQGVSINLLLDTDGAVGEAYQIGTLPLTVFIDGGRFIAKEMVGSLSADILQDILTNIGA